jgi:glucan endo-1,3-alpha-glucosidase
MAARLASLLAALLVVFSDAVGFVVAQGSRPVFAHFMVWYIIMVIA